MAAQFQFVMRAGPTVGKVYPLEAPEISIGREGTNIISINDVEVSRKHARMELQGASYLIQDLGSTNGTFVNGQRVTGMQVLNPGDSVSFGEGIILSYESAFDPNATMLSAAKPPRPTITAAPAPTPAPMPAPAIPGQAQAAPTPVYSGQIPGGPAPAAPVPAKKKKFPIWIIILIVILLAICACAVFFFAIDRFNLWCRVLPFLVPLLGGTCP